MAHLEASFYEPAYSTMHVDTRLERISPFKVATNLYNWRTHAGDLTPPIWAVPLRTGAFILSLNILSLSISIEPHSSRGPRQAPLEPLAQGHP